MLELVSREEAKAQLRIDDFDSAGSPDDLWLDIFIPAISEAVSNWLKDEWRLYEPELDSAGQIIIDSSGDPIPTGVVRWSVKAAVLVELASQYRYREGEGDNAVPSHAGHGYALCRAATDLLAPLRKSTVA